MTHLSTRDRELVALGAAVAANCIPCVEYHIPKAREAGVSDAELAEALELADKVRKVPAGKVLEAAQLLVSAAGAERPAVQGAQPCTAVSGSAEKKEACC